MTASKICIDIRQDKGCLQGKYSNATTKQITSFTCGNCSAGKYSAFVGPVRSCDGTCSAGRYSLMTGLITNDDCTKCDQNFYSEEIGASSNVCKACPSGFFTDTTGSLKCKNQPNDKMPPGTIAAIVAAAILFVCIVIGVCFWSRRQQTLTHQENEYQMAEMAQLHSRDIQNVLNPLEQTQYDIPSHDLQLENRIGQGGCGFIYKATMGGNTVVAAKEIMSTTIDPENIQEFEHEARMLTQLNHPQVLRVFGFCTTTAEESKDGQERRYIVTEFAPNGSLESVIDGAIQIATVIENTGSKVLQMPFTKMQALEWAVQIASGLAFLHRKGYVHRDMKPHNVLLNKSNDALVADLGTVRRPPSGLLPNDRAVPATTSSEEKEQFMEEFCQDIDEEQGSAITMSTLHGMTSMKGTPLYMAPEQFQQPDYSYPVDVWAYGVSMVRLFGLKWPYPANIGYKELVLGVARGQLSPLALELKDVPHEDVLRVVEDCLQAKGKNRPTMKEVERRLTKVLKSCTQGGGGKIKRQGLRATEEAQRKLRSFLDRNMIGSYYNQFVAEGINSKQDLIQIEMSDFIEMGISKIKSKKLLRIIAKEVHNR